MDKVTDYLISQPGLYLIIISVSCHWVSHGFIIFFPVAINKNIYWE